MYHIWQLRDLFFDQQATLGTWLVYDAQGCQIFKSECLERGWVNNENRISCLPEGDYPIVLEYSDKFEQELWEIKDTGHRAECKVHGMNYWWQSNGCTGLGRERVYMDGDAVMDVNYSWSTVRKFHKVMKGQTEAVLHIRNVPKLPMMNEVEKYLE